MGLIYDLYLDYSRKRIFKTEAELKAGGLGSAASPGSLRNLTPQGAATPEQTWNFSRWQRGWGPRGEGAVCKTEHRPVENSPSLSFGKRYLASECDCKPMHKITHVSGALATLHSSKWGLPNTSIFSKLHSRDCSQLLLPQILWETRATGEESSVSNSGTRT